jgi:hypothetical protein
MRHFAETQRLYAELVGEQSEYPELLADWGNAALGAGDLGTAALAYRRALALDRGLERAQKNLSWIRSQIPERLRAKSEESAVDSLFFWHGDWSLAKRHLVAAAAFAFFVLCITPWGGRAQGILRRAAILPLLLFIAALGSVLFEPETKASAIVVVDGETLYSADSSGAPVVMSPVPAGVEVTLQEERGTWSKVAFADGSTGWLGGGAVKLVQPSVP